MYTNVNNSVLVSDHKSCNKWIKSVINAKMDNNFLIVIFCYYNFGFLLYMVPFCDLRNKKKWGQTWDNY